ncbi:MAG TPA: sn-glycerol-3-phosphate ABC transporter ATP-binding protein UgpC [Devosia sp.]|nr:sn-glycerol-3-phosphate ABC transporter ATP-binding protein UgpC [Devosia sp.]
MATISLEKLTKSFGPHTVVHGIDLDIADGEFVVLVGPSGCGKSTTLRMIAGLEDISAGAVRIGGEVVNDREPKQRNIAMVFQNYAIYPHLTVAQNIGFGLYTAKLDKAEKQRRIEAAARTLDLEDLLKRRPSQLSGGQRQRVAIGRAMVRDPVAFLFDEPLSNLDAQLRGQMRVEIKRLHQRLKSTIVYVTHDQVEAMTMADRIVVMRDGYILQVGTPTEIYEQPADVFTARFIGSPAMNMLNATGRETGLVVAGAAAPVETGQAGRGQVLVGVRAHDLMVGAGAGQGGLTLNGVINTIEPLGAETLVHLTVGDAEVTATAPGKSALQVGQTVSAGAAAGSLYLFDAQTEKSLGRA